LNKPQVKLNELLLMKRIYRLISLFFGRMIKADYFCPRLWQKWNIQSAQRNSSSRGKVKKCIVWQIYSRPFL